MGRRRRGARRADCRRVVVETEQVWRVFDNTASGAAIENAWELRERLIVDPEPGQCGGRQGLFSSDLSRGLVVTRRDEFRVAEVIVAGPFKKFDLGH